MRRAVERLGEYQEQARQKVDTVQVPKPASNIRAYN